MLNVFLLSVVMQDVILLNVFMLSVIKLDVITKSVIMLNVVMLGVVLQSVIMLDVVMLNVIMLSVVMLDVVMQNVVMLSAAATILSPSLYLSDSILLKTIEACRVVWPLPVQDQTKTRISGSKIINYSLSFSVSKLLGLFHKTYYGFPQ
jgi:hypothetical protein